MVKTYTAPDMVAILLTTCLVNGIWGGQRATTMDSCVRTGRVEVRLGGESYGGEGERSDDGDGGQRMLFYDGGVKNWEHKTVGRQRGRWCRPWGWLIITGRGQVVRKDYSVPV